MDEAKPKRSKKPWHSNYLHFLTSDGMLAVGATNPNDVETLLSKRTEQNHLVFHANSADAGWVVLCSAEHSQTAIKECVEFAAALSPSWIPDKGADVCCVKPGQIAKRMPTGELLAKGYFFINGDKLWFKDVEPKLSIGVKVDGGALLVAGPVMATRKNSDYFVTLVPSATQRARSDIASEVKNRILLKARPEHKAAIEAVQASEIERFIPGESAALAQ